MYILISLIGGLGLFLYGMNIMGEGLQKSTGPKLEKAIELLTSNVVMGVLVGAVVTGIIQSSGATTVMVVGFVNAGIMTLYQAIGIIMGANIGTTVTAQLVSFDVSILSSIALGIGIVLYMIGLKSKPTLKNISEILIGFAILFPVFNAPTPEIFDKIFPKFAVEFLAMASLSNVFTIMEALFLCVP